MYNQNSNRDKIITILKNSHSSFKRIFEACEEYYASGELEKDSYVLNLLINHPNVPKYATIIRSLQNPNTSENRIWQLDFAAFILDIKEDATFFELLCEHPNTPSTLKIRYGYFDDIEDEYEDEASYDQEKVGEEWNEIVSWNRYYYDDDWGNG